ncbi:hypothetical protein C0991_009487, partial [Blastosporella zonata]
AGAATDKLLNAAALASPLPAPVQIAADIKNVADELPDSRVVPANVESTIQAETADAVDDNALGLD